MKELIESGFTINKIYRGKTNAGQTVEGKLSIISGQFQHIKPGYYLSNKAGAPFAYDINPYTLTEI